MDELKPCPFCGGRAWMECTDKFTGSGNMRAIVIFVDHDLSCMISSQNLFNCGFVTFDTESKAGKLAIDNLGRKFARRWNERAG